MNDSEITSESSRSHSHCTKDPSRKHSHITSESSSKQNHSTKYSSSKRSNLTSESSMNDSEITSESSKKRSHATSESSREQSHSTKYSSSKRSNLTSESSKKHGGITSKSCRKHHRSVSVSSREHCQSSRKHRGGSLRKGACRRHLRNSQLSSRQLVDCSSSSQNSMVTRSSNLAPVVLSPASSHSRRSSEANSANQCSKLSSSSSSSCTKTSAASGSKMECAVQTYLPLVIDATNIRKSRWAKTGSVCSVLDTIMDKIPECVGTVRELDDYILKVPGRKRRHANSLASQIAKAKVSDTLATCLHEHKSSRQEDTAVAHERKRKCLQNKDTPSTFTHKQKCSQHEDDTASVISLGSDDDDDVEIIDSDPKPGSGRSVKTDVDPKPQSGNSRVTDVIDTLHKRKPETVIIDLCSPAANSKRPVPKCMDREDEMSGSTYARSERAFKEYVSVLGDGFRTSRIRTHDVPSVSSHTASHCLVPFASSASASSTCDSAVNSGVEKTQDCEVVFIKSGEGGDKMNLAGVCGSSSQKHNYCDVRKRLQAIDNRMDQNSVPSSSAYGSNLYNPHPDTVRMGLRPIVIDGSNVAMG